MKEFDASFCERDREKRARHGMPWSGHDHEMLDALARRRRSLEDMCVQLQRPSTGVIPKLIYGGHIKATDNGYVWAKTTETQPETQEETTMNPEKAGERVANIRTQVLIRGRDASHMSDEEIFKLIAKLELEVEALLAIKAKSIKLKAAVDALNKDIADLVAYVDAR